MQPVIEEQTGKQIPVDYLNDGTFAELQKGFQPEFREQYNLGIGKYFSGEWAGAQVPLQNALKLRPDDGPSKTLMKVMSKAKFVAPANWKGFRALTSKT